MRRLDGLALRAGDWEPGDWVMIGRVAVDSASGGTVTVGARCASVGTHGRGRYIGRVAPGLAGTCLTRGDPSNRANQRG
jgi:hypothetical protein